MVVSMTTLGLSPVSPARDRQSRTELFALPKKVASWSHQGHGKSTELLSRRQTETQSIASSAFLKAINSHLSCSIDLLCETAASVIFFLKPYDWDLSLNFRDDAQGLICSIF